MVAESLSARRAWIEIASYLANPRNVVTSLSARRAWIEIVPAVLLVFRLLVALRKESVDRNDNGNPVALSDLGRSPQGERG